MRFRKPKHWLSSLGLSALVSTSAFAGEIELDFNSDPAATGLIQIYGGSPEWRADGGASGANGDGYLSITDARGGESGTIVFADLEPGLVVKAFRFEVDLRVGGGTAQPADGFSINYASSDDPVVTTGSGFSGTDGEANLPEEGTQTGLAIGFDTWQSGPVQGKTDVVGISIKVDNQLIAQLPVPLRPDNIFGINDPNPGAQGDLYEYNEAPYRNLAVDDANYPSSMQTGALTDEDLNFDGQPGPFGTPQPAYFPGDTEWPKWVKNLVWERFVMELTEESTVVIIWKGVELTPPGGLPVTFDPREGRIVFAGRTGGAWEVHHLDNIKLTTVAADSIILGSPTGEPVGFSMNITDSGPAVLDPETIELSLNGVEVTPTSVVKDGGTTRIVFRDQTNPLPAGSTQVVQLTASDTRGMTETIEREFVVPAYTTVNPEFVVTGITTGQPGFIMRVHQVEGEAIQATTVARAERQLRGDLGANVASTFNANDGQFSTDEGFVIPGVINFEQESLAAGAFNADNGFPDGFIPGIPGNFGGTDNIAAEILTYLHFDQVGIYQLFFNSDDGFRTYLGKDRDVLGSQILSQFDGGRGASDSIVTLYVETPGYYPVRSVWFEGGGGANLEWSAIKPGGQRRLINDTSNADSLRAFRSRTTPRPSVVSFSNPVRDSGNPYLVTTPIVIDILDGSAPVAAGSIELMVNGESVTPTTSKNGSVTTLTYQSTELLPSGATIEVAVAFSDANGDYDSSYTYNVASYVSVPGNMRMATGVDTSAPGFAMRVVQQDLGRGNSVRLAEEHLAGFYGWPNTVNTTTTTFDSDGFYIEPGVINYDQAAGNAGGFNANTGHPEALIPGIPGSATAGDGTDNISAEILTVIEFPTAGVYRLGFNSDDGFRTTVGHRNDRVRLMLGQFDGGRGASDTMYTFVIPQAGLYPMRTIWFEGGGGANLEWFSEDITTGSRALLNDPTAAGALKAYQYPRGSGPVWVKHIFPQPGSVRVGFDRSIHVVLGDGVGEVDPESVGLSINGEEVSPMVTKDGGDTTIMYAPAGGMDPSTSYDVSLSFGDRTINYSFTTGPLPDAAFFIEAEDFDFGGGQNVAAASDMSTYRGGAYAGRSSTANVDYSRPSVGDSPLYRFGEDPQVPMDSTADHSRVFTSVDVNFKLGWTGADQWFNYTRSFPEGSYNVYAALSHGGTGETDIIGSLHQVTAGVGTATQTLEELGTFNAAGTGGWGSNALVPMRNAAGDMAEVALGGQATVRFYPTSGDFDFLLMVPAGSGGTGDDLVFTSVVLNADGSITLEWEGQATLQVAPTINGPWTDVTGATSPTSVTPDEDQLFGRLVR